MGYAEALSKSTDVLVVGGGAAALCAARAAARAGAEVMMVSKGKIGASGCSNLAGSEYMAYGAALGEVDERDNPQEHEKDTLRAAMGVADEVMVRILTEETIDRFMELVSLGAGFDKQENGKFAQRVSDAASYPRVLGLGDTTGREMMRVLKGGLDSKVSLLENIVALDLLTDGKAVSGAMVWDQTNGVFVKITAKAVILATGGPGGLYQYDTFPSDVSGDGHGMAWRAGAEFVNTEFLQIGLVLARPRLPRIISATTWRLEPALYNEKGEDLLKKYLPAGVDKQKVMYQKATSFPFSWRTDSLYIDLAIYQEVSEGQKVYVDVSHHPLEKILQVCPNNYRFLKSVGLDISIEPIQVSCGVQHMNGGILIDEYGRASVAGLYAAGECAGGAHGADRPGGNALADTQVYGRRAGLEAARYALGRTILPGGTKLVPDALSYEVTDETVDIGALRSRLSLAMWGKALVYRDNEGLEDLLRQIDDIEAGLPSSMDGGRMAELLALRNALTTGRLIASAALLRTESRGTHYRTDYPVQDDVHWRVQIVTRSGADGKAVCRIQEPRRNGQGAYSHGALV